jgi:hypothetical protein
MCSVITSYGTKWKLRFEIVKDLAIVESDFESSGEENTIKDPSIDA